MLMYNVVSRPLLEDMVGLLESTIKSAIGHQRVHIHVHATYQALFISSPH